MAKKSFSTWYAENKGTLAKKRAEKYHTDPAYRQKVKEAARLYRMRRRGEVVPAGYVHHMAGASDALGITIWTLREWRKKNYFPEPHSFKGRLWFRQDQLVLLGKLKQFFDIHGARTSAKDLPALEALVAEVHSVWG